MALIKNLIHPASKATGSYIIPVEWRISRLNRECVARFGLFKDAAHAAEAGAVPVALVAKLRLLGADFDRYFGPSVVNRDQIAQLYRAAKSEAVISDFGALDSTGQGLRRPFDGATDA